MNKKGISLVSLAITIIVIIILASIAIVTSTKHVNEAIKVDFQNDLKSFVEAIDLYNQRALIYNTDYDSNLLEWDGQSDRAKNTAKLDDNINDDKITTILLDNNLPSSLEGVVYIEKGMVKVKKTVTPQYEWAVELYDYMK